MKFDRPWTACVTGFLLVLMLIGGTSQPPRAIALIQQIAGLALFVLAVLRLRGGLPSRAAAYGLAIIAFGIALVGLQLLPLPPALWTALPGREFLVESLAAAGIAAGWMPLSLSPPETRGILLSLLPALALFTAALTVRTGDRKFVATGLVIFIIFNVVLGLGQKFQGPDSALYFYEGGSRYVATGIFANRNFYAALLYAGIPVIAALAIAWARRPAANRLVVAFVALIGLGVVMIGLAVAASRAGILLAMAAVLACGLLPWGGAAVVNRHSASRLTMAVFFGALFLIAQFGLAGILRLASTDPVNDYRTIIFQVSSKTFSEVFPFGSGFGTFVPLYAMHETPSNMLDGYVNHAHNDWLELAIEGGAPMIALLLVFLLWYLMNTILLWRRRGDEDVIQRAAAISVGLLLLHSIVDYPLRTLALMGVFALFCGLIACGPSAIARPQRRRSASTSAPLLELAAARRKGPYFVRKDVPNPPD